MRETSRLPDWVAEARGKMVNGWPEIAEIWRPMATGGKLLRPGAMAELWRDYGEAVQNKSGQPPASKHAVQLILAINDGLDYYGSKAHPLKARRRPDGKAIAKAARELLKRLCADDLPRWNPGFDTRDPLHLKLTNAMWRRMADLDGSLPQAITRKEWTPRDAALFAEGQSAAIFCLPELLDAIATAGDTWAETRPGGHVTDAEAPRRHLLGELCAFMLRFTGARQPRLEALISDLFFEVDIDSDRLRQLNPSELDRALNKSQLAKLERIERHLLQRKQRLSDPEYAAKIKNLRGE